MFCDLVGSTDLSARLDPEELRDVVRAYQETCAAAILRFDGHIAQYLGDGLLVYFGYPQAHEDDAPRAVRAAVGIIAALEPLNARLAARHGLRVSIRIGVHTGLVVVGEVGVTNRQERLALGETPNLAARLQALAEPDAIVISATTHRLVEGFFTCRDLGAQTLKGISTAVAAYRVLAETPTRSRLEVAAASGLTPLVGREQEVALLLDRWEQVGEGLGQVVLVSGESGIGKSRLLLVLRERLAGTPHTRLECRCSPYHQTSPLYPVVDLLFGWLGTRTDEPAEGIGMRLDTALTSAGVAAPDALPLLASLLSIPMSAKPLGSMSPERQKQKTLEVLVAILMGMAARQPVLLIVEDLHWADASTLEFLGLVLDQAPVARLFVLLTARPEFRPPWAGQSQPTQVTLNRFTRTQTEVMVGRVAGGRTLPAELLQQVIAKTDGVPLFVEELTKLVLESGLLRDTGDGAGSVASLAIPATLRDSLMARLDRLAEAKEVAQLGATLGRSFPYDLLRAVSDLPQPALEQALARLTGAELLYRRGLPPQATYTFKHALIQDAAYDSLLRSTRQRYHQRIAEALIERFPEAVERQPEVLAHHLSEARLAERAIPYWQRAGERAIERSAHLEAIVHLTRGLDVLGTLPETPARDAQELGLQVGLGSALTNAKGLAAPDVGRTYARARELCDRIGDTPELFQVLHGLFRFHLLRAEMRKAQDLADLLARVSTASGDPPHLLIGAQLALGTVALPRGNLVAARTCIDRVIALYDPADHRSLAWRDTVMDPCVVALSHTAETLWLLGYPVQAVRRSEEALEMARRIAHPPTQGLALSFSAFLQQYRRDTRAARQRAEDVIEFLTEQAMSPLWLANATIIKGWTLVDDGEPEAGMAEMRRGLAAWQTTGGRIYAPRFHGFLAEAYVALGEVRAGLAVLAEALGGMDETGERYWESEIHRLRGELLLKLPEPDAGGAEASFHRALEVGRSQSARSLELRAATSLCRLGVSRGKPSEARALLSDVYGWFTEGFDTRDLLEARGVLATSTAEPATRALSAPAPEQ